MLFIMLVGWLDCKLDELLASWEAMRGKGEGGKVGTQDIRGR